MTEVRLTWPELRRAGQLGYDRFVRARSQQLSPTYGVDLADTNPDILGAWGEIVVAKITDHYWGGDLGRTDRGAPDVGSYHVRTVNQPGKRLLLHDIDPDNGQFVLVTLVRLPLFQVTGWCYGKEGKLDEYWETFTGRPAYFVPHSVLRPFVAT